MAHGAFRLVAAVLAATALAACGGGGGGSGGPVPLALQSVRILTQPTGPSSPFGTTQGGDEMQLTGTGFATGATVSVAGKAATIQTVSSQQILAITPPGTAGFATVTVTNPGGSSASLVDTFRYIAPPVVLAIEALTGPTAGESRVPIAGNETLRIDGSNLADGLAVRIGGVTVPATRLDATRATVVVPAVSDEQVVDVTVENPEGLTSTLTRGLTYTQEFSLDRASNTMTDARAHHLFRRAAFGAPPAQIARAKQDGMSATVDKLVVFSNEPTVEDEALLLYGNEPPPSEVIGSRPNKHWWIHLLVNNPNAFQERLAWFLHDHFATSERNFPNSFRWTMHVQANLFRRFSLATTDQLANGEPGLGYDWQRLLVEVCKDRAMLHWLDGRLSTNRAPNENFARELWELFMLGEGNGYTELDIQQAAKAFTGFFWYADRDDPDDPGILRIAYRPARHDAGQKTILGRTGFFGYDSVSPFYEIATSPITKDPSIETDGRDTDGGVVALTLRERPVEASRFICRKLWEFLVYEDPHDSVVDDLAGQLRAPGPNQWNLRPVLVRMLKSKAMYSSRAMKGTVKGPVDYVIGFLRSTDIRLSDNIATNAFRVRATLEAMDQVVLDPPDVNGWPTGLSWMGAQSMLERYNFLALAVRELDDFDTDVAPLLPRADPAPSELVDHLATLLDVQLSGNARTRFIDYVNSDWVGGQKVSRPFDPDDQGRVRLKTRGLIWMIGQYHDAHQN